MLNVLVESDRDNPSVKLPYNPFGTNVVTVLKLIGDILADFGSKTAWILNGLGKARKSKTMSIKRVAASPIVVLIPMQHVLEKDGSIMHYNNMMPNSMIYRMLGVRLTLSTDLQINSRDDVIKTLGTM